MIEFTEFDKISRLNRNVIVTEKIDGTNGQVHIRQLAVNEDLEMGYDTQVDVNGMRCAIRAGSRNRWVGCISARRQQRLWPVGPPARPRFWPRLA